MTGIELVVRYRLVEQDLEGVDVVFFNRVIPNVSIHDIEALRAKYGFKLIADFDDHWYLGKDHYLYEMYQKFQASELMEEWIKVSDAVTVTHERLFHDVFPLNQNVHILPNAIPEFGQFLAKKQDDPCVRLFWAGGVTHKNDLSIISRPLQKLKGKNVKLVMGGYVKENDEWKEMAKLYTQGSSFNTEVLEALPVEDYYYMYSKCDIAVIPLAETKFNSYKSNLKILEAANIGSPVVVSRVHPYLGFPEELVNYVDSQNPWFKQIKKLLDAPGMAKYQGEKLKAYCKERFNFDKINEQRKQLFINLNSKEHGKSTLCSEAANGISQRA